MSWSIYIPARLRSKRLPNKPLLDIGGKPMLHRVMDAALACKPDRLVVVTDPGSRSITEACERYSPESEVIMDSRDFSNGSEAVASAADRLNDTSDIIVLVQGDQPFITKEAIVVCRDATMDSHDGFASLYTQGHLSDLNNPSRVKCVISLGGYALYFSRAPVPWMAPKERVLLHVGVYGFSRNSLSKYAELSGVRDDEDLEQLRILYHGYRMRMRHAGIFNMSVDTEEDLFLARVEDLERARLRGRNFSR